MQLVILFGQNKKHTPKKFACMCVYKMVVEITKETWEKCGIKTVKHYNEKENVIELWQKVSDVKTQIKHSNVCDVTLKRIKKYHGKKKKTSLKKKNKNTKLILKAKQVFLLLKNLRVISLSIANYKKP